MAKEKVVSLKDRKAAIDNRSQFLDLIDADMATNPDRVVPMTRSLFDRIASACHSIRRSEADEAKEG